MPTIISHSIVAGAASFSSKSTKGGIKFLLLSIVCSIIPDADVLGYRLYIPYHSFFGHRGFFHSPFFAAILGGVMVAVFYRKEVRFSKQWWKYFFYFFLLTTSHGLLDALTNGGQGIALLSPFTNNRYFFPWQPIEVSPLSVSAFLSQRGLAVLKSEFLWIWLPSFVIVIVLKLKTSGCFRSFYSFRTVYFPQKKIK